MGTNKYIGPCPPSGIHQYHFKVYALDIKLNTLPKYQRKELMAAMGPHIISSGELLGLYEK
jgi:Raf kinase inhibitor-like YbhB/YbcL family protein